MTTPTRHAHAATDRSAAELRTKLAAERDLDAMWREDARARRAGAIEHRDALADVEERAAAAKRARRERATDAREAERLNALHRRATRSGERARLRARILGSAEVRALRVAKVRTVTLAVGIPVLLAFAAWSTTGVQAGVVRLLSLDHGSAAWWAAWLVEPAAIAVVAGIIVGRAVLRSSGGNTDWRAAFAECSFLGGSLALNVLGGWPAGSGWDGFATALPHAIGPAGAAATAWLIGLFDGYVSAARPWDGAPRLADLTDVDTLTAAARVPAAVVPETAEDQPIVTPPAPVEAPAEDRTEDQPHPVTSAAPTVPKSVAAVLDLPTAPIPEPLFIVPPKRDDVPRRPAPVPVTAPLFTGPAGPDLRPHDAADAYPGDRLPVDVEDQEDAFEDDAEGTDVSPELLALGRWIAAQFARDDVPLTRANLLDALRRYGRGISTDRATELLRQLKPAA
ncbi:hypothetical protein [Cryptosporangium aurantiacum]|uniref:Uncharacterized protein n=1 Tax=Cryptosporangium aurantiacum TaxID=134849 RepID=A0A1M7RJG6_9ACTN|nr:hypothetical protein [Cryptosporangium aurantiacum]SHN46453.1 hypothetical protein SAMN05443668_115142 [Cryptosporangium aurantiacum]